MKFKKWKKGKKEGERNTAARGRGFPGDAKTDFSNRSRIAVEMASPCLHPPPHPGGWEAPHPPSGWSALQTGGKLQGPAGEAKRRAGVLRSLLLLSRRETRDTLPDQLCVVMRLSR